LAVICGRVTCLPHPALLCHTHLLTRRKPDVWRELSAIPISWTAGAWATFRSLLAGLRRAQAQACIGGAEDGFWAFAARSDACRAPHHAACHRRCMFSQASPGMAHATCSRCPGWTSSRPLDSAQYSAYGMLRNVNAGVNIAATPALPSHVREEHCGKLMFP
jgi:hypothetical protein